MNRVPAILCIIFMVLSVHSLFSQPQEKQLTVEEIYTKIQPQLYSGYPSELQWLPESERFFL